MEKIAIVTDSSCDLNEDVISEYGINVLPLLVAYTNKTYRDRTEIKPQEVYDSLETEIPKTSMPSINDAKTLFERLKSEKYTHVLAISISSGLSGTYGMLNMVCKEYEDDMEIKLVDSRSLSMGLGFAVYEAAKAVRAGKSFEEISALTEKVKDSVNLFYIIKTLKYLRAGGRIGKVEATLGEMLNLKPIISIDEDGGYYSYTKTLGWNKAKRRLLEIFRDKAGGKKVNVAVMNGGDSAEAEDLYNRIKEMGVDINEIFSGQISPALVVHTGPGLLGFAFCEAQE